MTDKNKLQVRNAEIRAELAKLSQVTDTLSDEQVTQIKGFQKELESNELKLSAILACETEPEGLDAGEAKELQEVANNASVGEFAYNLLTGKEHTGAIKELQEKDQLVANQVPWVMFADDEPKRMDFADANTSLGSSVDIAATSRGILGRVFGSSATNYIGVSMVDARGMDLIAPVITAGSGFTVAAKHAAVDSVAATITTKKANATRMTANYIVALEDETRLMDLRESLQRDLRARLSSKVDEIVIKDNKSQTQTDAGFCATTGGLTAPTKPTANNYADTVEAVPSLNTYAESYSQMRLLASFDMIAQMISAFTNNNNLNAYEYIRQRLGIDIRGSEHLPATASDTTQGLITRQREIAGAALFVMFGSPQMVVDGISKANAGQVRITLNALFDFIRVRDGHWTRFATNNA